MIAAWIRFLLGTFCLGFGLFFIVSSVVGNYRFKFALNRMHAAALGDTLGLLGVVLGVCFYEGLNPTTAKLLAIIVLVWLTSPVSSHLIMLMELTAGRYAAHRDTDDEQGLEQSSVDLNRHALAETLAQTETPEEDAK